MPGHLRRTKIVATLGPASADVETLVRMASAGMDVARLNLSHGERSDHLALLEALRGALHRGNGRRVGVLFDLRGPEIRLGTFTAGPVRLVEGRTFVITTEKVAGTAERVSVDYPAFPRMCRPGDRVLLDDGNLALEVTEVRELRDLGTAALQTGGEVVCRVEVGGLLGDRKKINIPGRRLDVPYLSSKDEADLELAVEAGVDFVAASFTRRADDIHTVRDFLEARGGRQMIIAKIECQEALDNLDGILAATDGLMVARGDLGVEVPEEDVPVLQKDLIARCIEAGKPVITATQMLESMVENSRPTRAEASDVANAIFDGTDAVMLSAESAVGRHPVRAVATMARIAERAERAMLPRQATTSAAGARSVTGAISLATVNIAAEVGAGAIVTATTSGYTARMVSRHRPKALIIAVTSSETVANQQTLTWGVYPVRAGEAKSTDEMFLRATVAARQSGLVDPGSLIVITAGAPPGSAGTTNLIKVHTLGTVLARGLGVMPASATGLARVVKSPEEALARLGEGDILVTRCLDEAWFPAMLRAAAWVVEEGGRKSFAAVQARALDRVAVVGAKGAAEALPDSGLVTLDGARGLIYDGRASVL